MNHLFKYFPQSPWRWTLYLFFLLVVMFSIRKIFDADMGCHLRCGEWIVEHKQIFDKDILTYTVTDHDFIDVYVRQLWRGESREEMYLAIGVAKHFKKFRLDRAMTLYEQMLRSSANWDLVDDIAAHLVGDLVLQNRKHEMRLKKWAGSRNFWMRRASILAHLFHREKTNVKLFEETLAGMMHEKEFFIRKAIGWALRQYAKTNPKWVKRFVNKYEGQLSGLSRREALKHVG